jgi:hypothetical protein
LLLLGFDQETPARSTGNPKFSFGNSGPREEVAYPGSQGICGIAECDPYRNA